jgi:hypothetical protein
MPASFATLNGLRVVSVRLEHPWRGAWVADLDLDPDVVALAPTSGKATLTIGTTPLIGTIDSRASGVFSSKAKARLVGGGNGWDKTVTRQHYHSDAAVISTQLYATTGVQVGEVVTDLVPRPLGNDWVRTTGPASQVFDLPSPVEWHVDLTGVTIVGPRLPALPDLTLEILHFDPTTQIAELSSDAIVFPGTVLVDPRLGPAPLTVRTVTQVFDGTRSRAYAACGGAPDQDLAEVLRTAVKAFVGPHTRQYRYRVVLPEGGVRYALQAIDVLGPMPDMIPVDEWTGVSGLSADLALSLEVIVEFTNGDPAFPRVVGYRTSPLPTNLTADALALVHIGPSAAHVDIAGGAFPLVVAPWAIGLAAALAAFCTGLSTASDPKVVAAAAALASALGALAVPGTIRTTAT